MKSSEWENLTLDQVVEFWAKKTPSSLSIQFSRDGRYQGLNLTWAELEVSIKESVEKLRDLNLSKGDRVALVLDDSPICHFYIYAIMRLGAVLVPIDPEWGTQVIESIYTVAGPKVLLCTNSEMEMRFNYVRSVNVESLTPAHCEDRDCINPSSIDDIAIIAFTSGTTSDPKGVPLTHRNLRSAYTNGIRSIPRAGTMKKFACVFRLSGLGVLGIHYFLSNEIGAVTLVLPLLDVSTCKMFWQNLKVHDPCFIYLVPTLVKFLNHYSIPLQDPIKNLVCVTGAGPISADTFEYFQDRFGQLLLNIYGLTEMSFAVFFGEPIASNRGGHSIGPAIGVEAALYDDNCRKIDVDNVSGDLYLKGPMLMSGYYNNPKSSSEAIVDGWLRTGDIAVRSSDGNYSIVGRAKDFVIRGGFNIALSEIDEVLSSHPKVVNACSFCVPDVIAGEELLCLVQLKREDITELELKSWVSVRSGSYKVPRRIYRSLEELPRNGAGKILRNEVRRIVIDKYYRRENEAHI